LALFQDNFFDFIDVFVGNHRLSSEGKMIIFDDGGCALPHDVNPRQSFDIEFTLVAPEVPGDYVLWRG
jgi:hypothetical protein